MTKTVISVIVPVYNAKNFLNRCVASICQQTYKDLEIILVDDGSTDGSGMLCDVLASGDERIRVVHKQNGGQQDARSAGIRIAQGEYIAFVDADDFIAPTMYEDLLRKIGDYDFISSGTFHCDESGIVLRKWTDSLEEDVYKTPEKLDYFFDNLILYKNRNEGKSVCGVGNGMVSKLFKTAIVKIMYEKVNKQIRMGEDLLFVISYILNAKTFVISHSCYYYACNNIFSVSHTCYPHYLAERDRYYYAFHDAFKGHYKEESLTMQFESRFLAELFDEIPRYLFAGQDKSSFAFQYVLPSIKKICGKKIVLFGAGKVGKSYCEQLIIQDIAKIILWVDNAMVTSAIDSIEIKKPACILETSFDYVIIAVANSATAIAIKKQLITMGINQNKIIWERPLNIFERVLKFQEYRRI